MMSLLPFWALNVSVALLSMQGQKALGFHQKYLNLCYEDEQRSYGFGINDKIKFFGWTIPLRPVHTKNTNYNNNYNNILILILTRFHFHAVSIGNSTPQL